MPDNGKTPILTSAENGVPAALIHSEDESDFLSACRGESASSPTKKKKKLPTKRARAEAELDGSMVNMMIAFFEKTDAKLDKLVDKMASDELEHASMRNKVFNSLDDLHHLSMTDKMKVTSAIYDRKDFKIFLITTAENRGMLSRLILAGEY